MTRRSPRKASRGYSLPPVLIALAILPAIVGCYKEGRILSVGEQLEYRHPAVLWVYGGGWQFILPKPNGKNPLGLPNNPYNIVTDLSARKRLLHEPVYIHFIEDSFEVDSVHRHFHVLLDARTGQRVKMCPYLGSKEGYLCQYPELDENGVSGPIAGGCYRLHCNGELQDSGDELLIGMVDQPVEDFTKLLKWKDGWGAVGYCGQDILCLPELNCILLSPGCGYLIMIDLSKLPPPVETTTRDAATESE